jgi:hypothetical protein
MKTKVINVDQYGLTFDDGTKLSSTHSQDCCESHSLTFDDLTLNDFETLEFDLSNDNFFKKVPEYGIELIPITGYSVKIPGHGYNNGYYGTNIDLVLTDKDEHIIKTYDVSECQIIKE